MITTTTTTRYVLRSAPLINAPNVVIYARNMFDSTGKGSRIAKRNALKIMKAWELPDDVAKLFLKSTTKVDFDFEEGTASVIV